MGAIAVHDQEVVREHPAPGAAPRISGRRRLVRIPALDGLRGLAVLGVLAFHADMGWARGGFLGVDVFFVLSGFLITSLLLDERDATGRVALGRFWGRRARRLFPALGFLFVALLVFAVLEPQQPNLTDLRADMLTGIGYVANWHLVVSASTYFGALAPSPLRHLWSLAIEEQFYLVWPIVFVVVVRMRSAVAAVVALALVSIGLMVLLHDPGDPSRVYYGTDTHAHGLLLGAALAFVPLRPSRWIPRLGAVALLAALLCMWRFDGADAWVYRGGLVAFELAIVLVVAACAQPGTSAVGTVLAWRPLRAVGLVSYGLYLWHWPIFVLVDESLVGVRGWRLLAVRLLLTVAVTLFSYFVIEMPFRRGFAAGRRGMLLLPAVAGAIVAMLLLVSTSLESPLAFAARTADASHSGFSTGKRLRVMLVGDSTAFSLAPGIAAAAEEHGIEFVSEAEPGCALDWRTTAVRQSDRWLPISSGRQCNWPRRWPRLVDRLRPQVVILLFGPNDVGDHRIDGTVLRYGSARWRRHMSREVDHAVDALQGRSAKVGILLNPALVVSPGVGPLNEVYANAASRLGVATFELGPVVNRGGTSYRWDGTHFSEIGARATGETVARWVRALGNRPPDGQ